MTFTVKVFNCFKSVFYWQTSIFYSLIWDGCYGVKLHIVKTLSLCFLQLNLGIYSGSLAILRGYQVQETPYILVFLSTLMHTLDTLSSAPRRKLREWGRPRWVRVRTGSRILTVLPCTYKLTVARERDKRRDASDSGFRESNTGLDHLLVCLKS